MKSLIDKAIHGDMDSDRHLISIFAMALASRGKVFIELGVREGHTTEHYTRQQNLLVLICGL